MSKGLDTKRVGAGINESNELFNIPENAEVQPASPKESLVKSMKRQGSRSPARKVSSNIRELALKAEKMESALVQPNFIDPAQLADIDVKLRISPNGDLCFTF
eukprot:TRINITY_DN80197_c0_g1_i1.p1 TRINITY_DN80197_c0_g1~~TRINITY_DN80197_c0_g1_i1.p1  ORF type:complete len:103 (-),score=30.29 TRINITY_DN80197_c0_g1_i1:121-429(-)